MSSILPQDHGVLATHRVRRVAVGNSGVGNLWKADRLAKNQNVERIPTNLILDGDPVATLNSANAFAKFFSDIVTNHV